MIQSSEMEEIPTRANDRLEQKIGNSSINHRVFLLDLARALGPAPSLLSEAPNNSRLLLVFHRSCQVGVVAFGIQLLQYLHRLPTSFNG